MTMFASGADLQETLLQTFLYYYHCFTLLFLSTEKERKQFKTSGNGDLLISILKTGQQMSVHAKSHNKNSHL